MAGQAQPFPCEGPPILGVFAQFNFQPKHNKGLWDGTAAGKSLRAGTNVWVVEVEFLDGARRVLKGSTTIVC